MNRRSNVPVLAGAGAPFALRSGDKCFAISKRIHFQRRHALASRSLMNTRTES